MDLSFKSCKLIGYLLVLLCLGIIPLDISVPTNKNFLLNIVNNDEVNLALPNNDKLTIVLSTDLYYKQSVDILITASQFASQNKKLDIYVNTAIPSTTSTTLLTSIYSIWDGEVFDYSLNTSILNAWNAGTP